MGTSSKPGARSALAVTGLMHRLAVFDPRVVGTPPLGLDLAGSDIDIACHAPEPDARVMWDHFRGEQHFSLRRWRGAGRPVVASFTCAGWPLGIFAAPQLVAGQAGWRHFHLERRLPTPGGGLRAAVMAHRQQVGAPGPSRWGSLPIYRLPLPVGERVGVRGLPGFPMLSPA
ncbi:DUF4269 domain-containing protein [Ancylobacter oerskovii]|uniref:DUF4269 domain-containing protein n=1 Tax=Ancylobacter oerskovii TaxID=459519 RepID=A0ABW4YV12_9HYPH|nr:DUF4269 domain-containing protein [Ancylobacter oerskovii]MBS7544434.1 DUF4269 domain-containing protein [Ancylobacter oerskovii]